MCDIPFGLNNGYMLTCGIRLESLIEKIKHSFIEKCTSVARDSTRFLPYKELARISSVCFIEFRLVLIYLRSIFVFHLKFCANLCLVMELDCEVKKSKKRNNALSTPLMLGRARLIFWSCPKYSNYRYLY